MRRLFQASKNTHAEFDRDVSYAEVEAVLTKLARFQDDRDEVVCYVYGMGAHPRSTYQSMQKLDGVHVEFFRSLLPRKLPFLTWFIASYEGLIRIEDLSLLPNVFLTLMELSMVGVYFMDKELASGFVMSVKEKRQGALIDFGIKDDAGYSIYIVDADNVESMTGMIEIISYGRDVPMDLLPVVP
ncbi:hypothetical protein ACO0LG_28290 [Undibacterium sp. Ji42W]|uniref:hypothetical protein n=1 Tax=Undibacterium sp. Ji42W TaxID=3413039 RepID=UPI003BF2C60C